MIQWRSRVNDFSVVTDPLREYGQDQNPRHWNLSSSSLPQNGRFCWVHASWSSFSMEDECPGSPALLREITICNCLDLLTLQCPSRCWQAFVRWKKGCPSPPLPFSCPVGVTLGAGISAPALPGTGSDKFFGYQIPDVQLFTFYSARRLENWHRNRRGKCRGKMED